MGKLIGMAVVGGVTVASVLLALLLEGALLKVILGAVARAKVTNDSERELTPDESYPKLRTVAH